MRIDFQQGEHLRVGHVLITWHPDVSHHRPGLHEVGMSEVRGDARKVEKVAHLAEEVVADAQPIRTMDGEFSGVPARQMNRLGEALTDWHLSVEHERFGGIACPVRGRLLCVGWKDASPPPVDRLRPSEAKRRLRHKLRRWLGIVDHPMTFGGSGGVGAAQVGISHGGGSGGAR